MARISGGWRVAAWLGVCLVLLLPLLSVGLRATGLPMATDAGAHTLVVAKLGPGAQLVRLAAASDDLYVIDNAAGHVLRYVLHDLPYAELFAQVMRWRERANGLIMGRPVDLFLAGERLLILDDSGLLWSYWGPAYSRVVVPLRLQSDQGRPRAVALHGGALLLLDPSRRQVWLYRRDTAGGYDTVPRALLPRPLPALAGATRLAVSRDALLALRSDGSVLAIPWSHPRAARQLRLLVHATGIWAMAAHGRFLVSSARSVALRAPGGALLWQVAVRGLDGAAIRAVALSPAGRLYVLTDTRILRVDTKVPALDDPSATQG
jgi:hypothetical protein